MCRQLLLACLTREREKGVVQLAAANRERKAERKEVRGVLRVCTLCVRELGLTGLAYRGSEDSAALDGEEQCGAGASCSLECSHVQRASWPERRGRSVHRWRIIPA